MHLDRRLMLSLFGCVALVSSAFALYQAAAEIHALRDEVRHQAMVLAESQYGLAAQALASGSREELQGVVDRFGKREQMAGAAVYDAAGVVVPAARTALEPAGAR